MKVINKKANNSGVIMMEALIVFPMVVFILFLIISLFSVYYQHWNYNLIAEEIAMRASQTYRYKNVDLLTGEISKSNINDLSPYRYWFYSDTMVRAVNTKAQTIVGKRSNMFFGGENITVSTKVVHDTMGRRHIEVDLTAKYNVPFIGIFEAFGMKNFTTCHVTTYADCFDAISYMNSTDFVKRITNSNKLNVVSDIINLVEALF